MKPTNSHIFGPVPSRRLGLSLGIDLVPPKTCTYDCIYCQVGRTTKKTVACQDFFSVQNIVQELSKTLLSVSPDIITFSGSGEPTLYSKIDKLIAQIKRLSNKKIALLTNGSLIWRDDVREKISGVDIIMPTITTVFNNTFRIIHRPHTELNISQIIEGLIKLRRQYKGSIYLELFIVVGINDSRKELLAIKDVIRMISPDKIQINTVVRPPSDEKALAVSPQKLREVQDLFGPKAEIIADKPPAPSAGLQKDKITHILDMATRRPIRKIDIANTLGIDTGEVQLLIKRLLIKGMLSKYEYLGETYYRGRAKNEG